MLVLVDTPLKGESYEAQCSHCALNGKKECFTLKYPCDYGQYYKEIHDDTEVQRIEGDGLVQD